MKFESNYINLHTSKSIEDVVCKMVSASMCSCLCCRHRSDPFFAQGRSGVARRGNYCTDNSHLSIFLFGGADYSATLIAHEMGHLLGLGHDKDGGK